jgi:hypothetical protein
MRALTGKRRADVSHCAALLALAVAVAACGETAADDTTVGAGAGGTDSGNAPVCPEPPPTFGAPCSDEGLSCAIGPDNPCAAAPAVCVDGTWQERSPEYCGRCPSVLPIGAPPCGPVGLECTYPGQPMDHHICDVYTDRAICAPDGAWTVATLTESICDPCPEVLPSHGAACFVDRRICAYTIDTPCGMRAAEATCHLEAGTWMVALPPCLCGAIADESVCAIASGCQWIDAGACAPAGSVGGCRPTVCSEAVCDAGAICAPTCDATVPSCECDAAPLACAPGP